MLANGALIESANEAEWLAARQGSVGASEAAAAMGFSPWETPIELWQRKAGIVSRTQDESEAMRWGKMLEPLIATEYTRRTGRAIASHQVFVRHERHGFMTATLDGAADDRIVEFKAASGFGKGWGDEDTDEIPDHYLIQVHHQMACARVYAADVAVLIGGNALRIYSVPPNFELIGRIEDAVARFWACVESRTPPDWGRATAADLAAIHPECFGEIELPGNVVAMVREYEETKARIAELEERADGFKLAILAAMGDARDGLAADGRRIVRRHLQRVKESTRTVTVKEHVRHYFTLAKGGS